MNNKKAYFLLIAVFFIIYIYRVNRSFLLCLTNDTTKKSTIPSNQLANYESFGYFDDIDDTTWKRHQDRARNEPTYFNPQQPYQRTTEPALWLLSNVDPMFACPNIRRVGGRGDGPKWTCDPHRLAEKPDCLIYSVGSRGVYRFEDGIINILKANTKQSDVSTTTENEWLPNCEIHVFDPNPSYGRANDPIKKNIHYHAIGLKSSYEPFDYGPFPKTFEFLSFQDIQKRLGHENRRIDVFKIDCEGCEWLTYLDWLQPNVDIRQILMETHFIKGSASEFFDRFFDLGYLPYSKEANTHPQLKYPGQLFEWGFIKLHPNFLRRKSNLMNFTFLD
jgi:Methyltransferase domain